jgi:DNA-binding transcriptional MerR regulator/uncharacterized protein (DUF433 family)
VLDVTKFVATKDRAAFISGLSPRQVDYWSKTGLVQPSVDVRLTPHRPIRLFSFVELMSLMVAAELRRRGISLQHIRSIVAYLRAQGFEQPLSELTFATEGSKVYIQHADGTWDSAAKPGQGVLHQVIELDPLRRRISQAGEREAGTIGKFERRRGALGSKEVIAGTRVPVDTVRRYLEAGRSVNDVVKAFPVLKSADVAAVRDSASA